MGLVEGTAARPLPFRRCVTRTAASVGSAASTPASTASAAYGFLRGLLRLDRAALPAVDAGEGDAEPLGELFLSEVEASANGAQHGRNVG